MTSFRRARSYGFLSAFVLVTPVSALATDGEPDLIAVARASARPEECGGAARTTPTRWDRARVPELDRYCAALARGYAALRASPQTALEASAVAERALPGRAAPATLAARAQVMLGTFQGAWENFERAAALSKRGLESPSALHDFAIAAIRTAHADAALGAYRTLIPRVALLDDAREAVRVLVESGVLAMNLGADHLPESIGYLTEARRRIQSMGDDDYALAALALAESRRGRDADAAALAEEASGPWRLEAVRARPSAAWDRPELPAGELDAMIALLAEGRDHDLAASRWESFLAGEGAKRPYAAHARNHRAALTRGGKPSGAAP